MQRSIADILDNLDHVGCDNETARELCEQVQRLHELRDAALEWYDAEHRAAARIDESTIAEAWDDLKGVQDGLTRLYTATKAIKKGSSDHTQGRIDELRDALEHLIDEQNGPPLAKRERQWTEAMLAASSVLGRNKSVEHYRQKLEELTCGTKTATKTKTPGQSTPATCENTDKPDGSRSRNA